MGRTLTEILWQLERKRKYCCSYGTNRLGTFVIAKVVTLVLFLCIVYLVLCAVLDTESVLDYSVEVSLSRLHPPPLNALDTWKHRSEFMKHGYEGDFRNKLETNNFNDVNGKGLKPSQISKLTIMFRKADLNGDKSLDEKELSMWINAAVRNHFARTVKDNFDKYFLIDSNPRNGLVSWEEYLEYFFRAHDIHGISADDIRNLTPAFRSLPQDAKVEIARIQASWSEASGDSPEHLTVDEFLSFEHPEASPTKILAKVQDIFGTFDFDGDGVITEKEFDTTYKEAEGVDRVYQNDKRIIDTDGNGQISRVELMVYMDPRNFHHSMNDAKVLIKIADTDKDQRLSLEEVLRHGGSFVNSKFYNVEKHLHTQD